MQEKKKIVLISIGIMTAIVIGIIMIYINQENSYESINIFDEIEGEFSTNITQESNQNVNNVENESQNITETGDNEGIIAIHITGEVKKPGILYLKAGARIVDAIKEAGGATKNADLDRVNLAYVLSDGQKIYIPNKNEKDEAKAYIISNSGENILLEEGNSKGTQSSEGVNAKVNINTAQQTELETLPGIGPSLAQRIIEYRETNGNFQNIEDLQNVKGIGDSKYSNIKDSVCI